MDDQTPADLSVNLDQDHVATVEIRRPPHNYFDAALIRGLAETLERLDADEGCRAVVVCSEGRHFCAGADFRGGRGLEDLGVGAGDEGDLYRQALRLFRTAKPVVAAVQGGAIGGGLGLACAFDFRVAGPESWFSANFARLGIHQGFGLSVTLPALVGRQRAMDLLYRGRRVGGEEAASMGLCDLLVPSDQLRQRAQELAADIACSAPLAVVSIRQTLREGLDRRVEEALEREAGEQLWLFRTADAAEGLRAAAERRLPRFGGR